MIPVPAVDAVSVESLAGAGHAALRPRRSEAGRQPPQSDAHLESIWPRRRFASGPGPLGEAIARALVNEDREFAETRWSDALSSAGSRASWGGQRFGSRLVDSRTVTVDVPPEQAFAPIRRIGGRTGWYYGNWLWSVRGFLDLLVGGVGVRRGRRDAEDLHVGDPLDFWRVELYEPPQRLRLHAEMKLPGRAWLEFEVTPCEHGSTIRQTAIFDPLGLLGLLYWYGIYPLHQFVFAGMLRNIVREAADRREHPSTSDSSAG